MTQTPISYHFFRGGSSRGPFFKRGDLPADQTRLAAILSSVLGSGHALNIDGLGGGNAVTTKVAMLSESADDWADVDYFFAQVNVMEHNVDFKPTCGNLMTAVGPAAIEMGLVEAVDGVTEVKILATNTGARVVAKIQTPGGNVIYDGDTVIDGVPGSAAPVSLDFMSVTGSFTGVLLPTGNATDLIEGVEVSCVDFAMPMVIARAESFGLTGYESREELDANTDFFSRMEAVRLAAAVKMGLGDCRESVTPKFGLLSPARHGGTLSARYFMPWSTHPTMALTGSQCLAACAVLDDTVASGLYSKPLESPHSFVFEHPLGKMEVTLNFETGSTKIAEGYTPVSAGLVRTARKLARGEVFVPTSIWNGK